MVATISAASDQYHHSVNTLKYADRAKEIKTHVVQNVGTVERHIADYKNIIDNLQVGSVESVVTDNMDSWSQISLSYQWQTCCDLAVQHHGVLYQQWMSLLNPSC